MKGGYNTDRATKQILAQLRKLAIPSGYWLIPAGEIEGCQESFGGFGYAILIAAFGILVVLLLEFKIFKSTLIVASVIPLGVIGDMLALVLSGETLSFDSMIGFIALMGIELKNSALLVDFTNQRRRKGMSVDNAIQQAGEIRFALILLATLTVIGSLLPLVIEGAPLYAPLALVIVCFRYASTSFRPSGHQPVWLSPIVPCLACSIGKVSSTAACHSRRPISASPTNMK